MKDETALPVDRRHLLGGGLALAATSLLMPQSLRAAAFDEAYLRHVDPELRPAARGIMQAMGNLPPLSHATLVAERKGMERFSAPPLADVPWQVRRVPGPRDNPDLEVVIVNARADGPARPALLHTHGGGFVTGSARSSVRQLQAMCRMLDCVAVSVEYRLAPETTWRGSLEDNYAGLKWLHANAPELGVDPARIALLGESAGGGHAALLAIAARDRGEVPVAFQCLVYPMLDDRTGSSRAVPDHVGRIIWNAQRNRFGWESFLGMAPGTRRVPTAAVAARQANLAGLPPAFIGVGTIDLFFDEDVDYAQRLANAGVPTELIVVPGGFHGFDNMPGAIGPTQRFNAAKLAALRRGMDIPAAG